MRLTLKFFMLVGTLLAAIAVSAAAGYRALNSVDGALGRVVDLDVQRLLSITHARRVFRSMTVLERDMILARSPSEREGGNEKMQKLAKELTEHLDHYQSLMIPEDAPRIQRIRDVRDRWLGRDAAVLAAAVVDIDQALTLAKRHKEDPVSWEKEIGALVELSGERLDKQVVAVHEEAHAASITLLSVSGLAALVALGLGSVIFFGIRRNVADVLHLNTNLERLVAERTAALNDRERSLRLVLDSTGDGFIVVDLAGAIQGECSQAAVRWFGEPLPGIGIGEYLQPGDPTARVLLEMAFAQLGENVIPWEVGLDQVPKRLRCLDRTLELELRQVFEDQRFAKVLVIAHDVTERLRGEHAERHAREQQTIISKLLADKSGFAQFVAETEQLLEGLLVETDAVLLARRLHTLKGNVGIFGMQSLADTCHALEEKLTEDGGQPHKDELQRLQAAWRARLQEIDGFVQAARTGVFEVELEQHSQLVRSIAEQRDYPDLLALVDRWTWIRTADVLARLRAQIEFLARKLHKGATVTVRDNGIRISNDAGYARRARSCPAISRGSRSRQPQRTGS
jgi:HPt (histidine-containing phosphotransfer) domain-containing protein/PAS domain-containing protein